MFWKKLTYGEQLHLSFAGHQVKPDLLCWPDQGQMTKKSVWTQDLSPFQKRKREIHLVVMSKAKMNNNPRNEKNVGVTEVGSIQHSQCKEARAGKNCHKERLLPEQESKQITCFRRLSSLPSKQYTQSISTYFWLTSYSWTWLIITQNIQNIYHYVWLNSGKRGPFNSSHSNHQCQGDCYRIELFYPSRCKPLTGRITYLTVFKWDSLHPPYFPPLRKVSPCLHFTDAMVSWSGVPLPMSAARVDKNWWFKKNFKNLILNQNQIVLIYINHTFFCFKNKPI